MHVSISLYTLFICTLIFTENKFNVLKKRRGEYIKMLQRSCAYVEKNIIMILPSGQDT